MRQILLSIAILFGLLMTINAQNNISLYVYMPEQHENVPEGSANYLVNSLCNAISTDGLAAQNDYLTQFVLVPKVNVVTKNIVANTQQQVVLTMDVTIQVIDGLSGTIFSSQTVNLKGVGTNDTKAYNSAFRSLNKNNAKIQQLAATAKKKIISYYDSESDNIIKRARLLAMQENYEEAFYLISMIPSQCDKYDVAISAALDIWKKYKDYSCVRNIAKARSVWYANQSVEAANEAGIYLGAILQDASCYGEAQELYQEIKKKVGDMWKFTFKTYDNEHELRIAKVKAFQEIGVAYGKGQQPGMIIYKSKY